MVGQPISACERAILAKAGAEAAEKAELVNSGKETSAGEDRAGEGAMENVVFHGEKIGAWAAWSIQAKADIKEAHVEPIEVKATEEASVGKAALGKEATYEQRVEAWIECFGAKANGKKAKKETAKEKAAPRKETMSKSPWKRIVFRKG